LSSGERLLDLEEEAAAKDEEEEDHQ